MKAYWISFVIFIALIFGSCNSLPPDHGNSETLTSTASLQENATQMPTSNPLGNPVSSANTPDFSGMTPPPSITDPFVRLAKQDLANRLKISVDQINFLSLVELTWPDLSQGCDPNKGQRLPKGKTLSGYRIWLEVEGIQYIYHVGLDGQIIYCQK